MSPKEEKLQWQLVDDDEFLKNGTTGRKTRDVVYIQ